MTRRIWAALIAAAMALALAVPVLADNEQVCDPLNSGKIDTTGDPLTVEVTAPDGFLIDGYCVKAGSAKHGNGPELVDVDPPAESVVISHSSGKAVSHYSVSYVEVEPDPEPELDCEDEDYANRNPEECEQGPDPTTPTTAPTPGNLPCVVDCGPPDSMPEVVPDPEPVVTTPPATTPPELPFTGPSDWLIPLAYAGLGMLFAGSAAAWFFRDRLS